MCVVLTDESTSPQGDNLKLVPDVSSTKEDLSSISTLSRRLLNVHTLFMYHLECNAFAYIMYTDQSRVERHGSTIRSRNLRSDNSEPSQHYTPPPVLKSKLDDDNDDETNNPPEYSESTRLSTVPTYLESNENGPPRYNLPYIRPPAYITNCNQQPPASQQDSEAINNLHTQPDDSDSQTTLISNDSQPHEEHQVNRCQV